MTVAQPAPIDGRLELIGVEVRFGAKRALAGVDLDVGPGEILALIGPSGAGKSTTCRVISGIERPHAGRLRLRGAFIEGQPAQLRGIGYMFESYALYPRLTVFDNVAFPLCAPGRRAQYSEAAIRKRVHEALELAEIRHLDQRLPSELSGGQRQRVALCRVLVQDPSAFLLDEPIAHLDAKLRHKLRGVLRRRLIAQSAPILWCTPDGIEALSVGDRVAVLIDGVVEQVGRPDEVYAAPATTKVARLIGDPGMNLLRGRIRRDKDILVFANEAVRIALPERMNGLRERAAGEGEVILGFRATDLHVTAGGLSDGARGEIYAVEPFGKYSLITARLGDAIVKAKTTRLERFETRQGVTVTVDNTNLVLFDTATGKSIQPAR